MNGHGLALPGTELDAQQREMAAAALDQNERILAVQARTNAVGLAVQLAGTHEQHRPISVVLGNARHIAHFLTTGQVPAEAKRHPASQKAVPIVRVPRSSPISAPPSGSAARNSPACSVISASPTP